MSEPAQTLEAFHRGSLRVLDKFDAMAEWELDEHDMRPSQRVVETEKLAEDLRESLNSLRKE